MALNLSTLTNPATSGGILAEALTTADFLDPVPILKNLSRGSNKGGDAKQTTALNQPKALPLIDGDGYLYLSGVSGNNARIADSDSLTFLNDIEIIVNFKVLDDSTWRSLVSKYQSSEKEYLLTVSNADTVQFYRGGGGSSAVFVNFNTSYADLKPWMKATHRLSDGRCQLFFSSDGITWNLFETLTMSAVTPSNSSTDFFIGGFGSAGQSDVCKGAIKKVIIKDGIDGTEQLNCDFTATNVRHGDTKFKCATGQVVTINQSGNDPATIIKKSVLRFDGTNSSLQGLFANNINSGYMFAAFSVLGTGGETYGRVFSVQNSTEGLDYTSKGVIFSLREQATNDLGSYYNSIFNLKNDLFDDDNGDILHEVRSESGQHLVSVNGSSLVTNSRDTSSVDSDTFNISRSSNGASVDNAAIDLEYLALFDATITDDQADSVRNYINKRNNVFSLIDSQGYYFFDPQKASFTGNFTGSNTLGGYITGSDLGDTDVRSNLTLEQSTLNDQPSTDGYTITFNDAAEHLEFENAASQTLAGWQVCGTSLGTFAYRVDNDAVTELNLLGNLGNASYRKAGDLYGIILLPESATGADIEAARKLLIDRGAADGVTGTSLSQYFRERADIVDFHNVDTSNISSLTSSWSNCSSLTFFPLLDFSSGTNFYQTWFNCSSLESFPLIDASSGTNFYRAWRSCISLNDFAAIDARNGTSFQEAWQNCSALTSFPAGAKLGTEAENVNFDSAWRSSGLTSFPALDLSKGDNFYFAWIYCPLSDFSADAKLGTNANLGRAFESTLLTSFQTPINTARSLYRTWNTCNRLVDFSADVFLNWNPSIINSSVFHETWAGCSALSADSVENILTSIDASNQHGTDDGTSTGNPLGDSGIDIDYNVATGSLSAATNAAVTSLKSKGWSIIVNNVTL